MIFHRHHLHPVRMKGQPTLQHGYSFHTVPQILTFYNEFFAYSAHIKEQEVIFAIAVIKPHVLTNFPAIFHFLYMKI